MKYADKLLDPRWQKKRLKIFERDKWACQRCDETTKTLHVHHLKYTKRNLWEEPLKNLLTYCCDCHLLEKEFDDLVKHLENEYNNSNGYDLNDYDDILVFIWNFFNHIFQQDKLSNPLDNYDPIWAKLIKHLGIKIVWNK